MPAFCAPPAAATPLTPSAPPAAGVAARSAGTADAQWRRGWRLAVALWGAWLALGSGPVYAAQDGAVVLPSSALATEQRAPLTQAIGQAISAAHILLIGATELDTVLQGETALRGCTTPTCLARLGRLLGASAVVRRMDVRLVAGTVGFDDR